MPRTAPRPTTWWSWAGASVALTGPRTVREPSALDGAYDVEVSSNPPTGEPEQRWQQPSFGPQPSDGRHEFPGYHPQPPVPRPFYPVTHPVPPASTFETVIGTLSKLVWPIAILLLITTNLGFFPLIITAIVVNVVLGSVKKNLRQRRHAALPPPPAPPAPRDELR